MDLGNIADHLVRALGGADPASFEMLIRALRDALAMAGIHPDRIQLPMARDAGFRHPTLGVLLLTWTRGDDAVRSVPVTHAALDARSDPGPTGTPFEDVVLRRGPPVRVDLHAHDGGYPILRELRAAGYRDYCAYGIPMPSGWPQAISLASRDRLPDDLEARLARLDGVLGLAVYGVYRTSQAMRMAQVYVGPVSGPRVLAGEIVRGTTRRVEAGIAFCDVRGFTAMSERLGAERVVGVVNRVFVEVEAEAVSHGGEILKFMGDAMLIVFPADGDRAAVCAALVEAALRAAARVDALGDELGEPVAIGFGVHLGEVVQGNVGTPERLDFTVMGPAVNLAARLERLCSPLGARAVFSAAVADHVVGLRPAGSHTLKGVSAPVPVWVAGG